MNQVHHSPQDFARWLDLDAAVTVCDAEGIVLFMNRKSISQFGKDGGETLVGKSLFDCHGPVSSEKIRSMIAKDADNCYIVDKGGKRKLVWQVPWHEHSGEAPAGRRVGGLVEISFPIDGEIPVIRRG